MDIKAATFAPIIIIGRQRSADQSLAVLLININIYVILRLYVIFARHLLLKKKLTNNYKNIIKYCETKSNCLMN
jgi:hypothetical protein